MSLGYFVDDNNVGKVSTSFTLNLSGLLNRFQWVDYDCNSKFGCPGLEIQRCENITPIYMFFGLRINSQQTEENLRVDVSI